MIRLFIVIGIVGVVLLGYMATYGQGPDYQMSPSVSLLKKFEAEGVVPAANDVSENEEVEHWIFEVPPEDEIQLAKAIKDMGNMSGMNMSGMNMEGDGAMEMEADAKPAMKMKLNPDGTMMDGRCGR